MMNKILINIIKLFLLLVLLSSTAIAHKSKSHAPGSHFDPVKCIKPEDRTPGQLKFDIQVNKTFHRLSKRQQDCAIYEIQQLEKGIQEAEQTIDQIQDENEQLQQSLENAALCADISFNHKSKKGTKLFAKPSLKSNKIADVKSGADLLYVSDSSSQKKWSFVLLKTDKKCSPGYIQKQFISKKDEV